MAYNSMKKLIENQNAKLSRGLVTPEQNDVWRTSTLTKLDLFLSMDRLSAEQYNELVEMMA
jgi:hypothetical protein